MRVHRLALDEQALDRVERRKLVVARLERAHLGFDAEQRRDEILEVRRERDQQLRLVLARSSASGRCARRGEPVGERRVSAAQVRDEQRVDARRALADVEVGEREAGGERERSGRSVGMAALRSGPSSGLGAQTCQFYRVAGGFPSVRRVLCMCLGSVASGVPLRDRRTRFLVSPVNRQTSIRPFSAAALDNTRLGPVRETP